MEQQDSEIPSQTENNSLAPVDRSVELPTHPDMSSPPSLFPLSLPAANTVNEAEALDQQPPPRAFSTFTTQSYFSQGHQDFSQVPSPELIYHYSRADKDAEDPSASTQRRGSNGQSGSSTRTTLTRLFAVSSPNSQPYSRQTSFLRSCSPKPSMKSLVSEGLALGTHIYNRGLLEGRHSDICLKVFGSKYKLHRLILEQAPYFASTFAGPWLEASADEIELHPEDTDSNISKEAFELALKRIYGCRDPQEEVFHCLGLLATACWLEMQELINDCVEIIIRTLQATNLSPVINLVTSSYYGKAGDMILQSANILLSREGSTIPTRSWDNIPAEIIRSSISADEFFVKSEWERWCLAKRLLDRRLKLLASLSSLDQKSPASQSALRALRRAGRHHAGHETVQSPVKNNADQKAMQDWRNLYNHADITALYALLDDGIHYIHLDFEALQRIKAARDVFGVPVTPPALISDALWASIEFRQKVVSANRQDPQLGLTQLCRDAEAETQDTKLTSHADSSKDPQNEAEPDGSAASQDEEPTQGEDDKEPKYLIPRCDCNIAIGANPAPIKTSESRKRARNHLSKTDEPSSSVEADTTTSAQIEQEPEPESYSHIPPFRFSVQFPSLPMAEQRKSVHSQGFFYAGSFWNLHIQKYRKGSKDSKLPQLGVYLRRAEYNRQSESDFPPRRRFVRSVDERIGDLERGTVLSPDQHSAAYENQDAMMSQALDNYNSVMMMYNLGGPTTSPILIDRPATPVVEALHSESAANAGVIFNTDTSEDENMCNGSRYQPAVIPPYVDSRPYVKVYFKIFCPSPGGRSLNIWESVPTSFRLNASQGWRSSSLQADTTPARGNQVGGEDIPLTLNLREDGRKLWENDDEGEDETEMSKPGNSSQLRFSVVVGVV